MNLFTFIKSHIQILDVIGQYVTLKKAGLYYKGTCPFHSEKTASFTVSAHREIFYCFGCHATGDVIAFIALAEHCSQIEAAQHLVERYGLELPKTITAEHKDLIQTNQEDKKRYFELCRQVASWCSLKLKSSPLASTYFLKRKFDAQTLSHFEIGYFPGGSANMKELISFLATKKLLVDDLLNAHIVEQGKQMIYSPFEERLIFPIKDHLGRFCGFGGRTYKEDDERAKYYNSRENQFFNKGSLLFGLDLAKKNIQDQNHVFLVEGYTDCMAMVAHGYKNTVATLGTACTSEQLKILSRHCSTLYIVYDGDSAGQKAMLRLARLCWEVSLEPRVITLPATDDPASFLEKGGDLASLISQAKDIFMYYIDTQGASFSTKPLNEKMHAATELIDLLKTIDDPLKRDILLQHASSVLSIPFESLNEHLTHPQPAQAKFAPKQEPMESAPPALPQISLLEKKLFSVILSNSAVLNKSQGDYLIKHFTPPLSDILEALQQAHESSADGSVHFIDFLDSLPIESQKLVTHLLLETEEEDPSKAFDGLLVQFQKKHWKAIVYDIRMKIGQAELEENEQKVKTLLATFEELKKRLLHKGPA
jgi:DNA primase